MIEARRATYRDQLAAIEEPAFVALVFDFIDRHSRQPEGCEWDALAIMARAIVGARGRFELVTQMTAQPSRRRGGRN